MVTLRLVDIDRETSVEEKEYSKTVEEIFDKYYSEFDLENGDDDKNNVISNDESKKSQSSEKYSQVIKSNNKLQYIK